MSDWVKYLHSSIGKKQIVAATGLLLIVFVIAHLAGNLFLYAGPQAFNDYAQKITGLRPALYIFEIGLLFVFVIHLWITALLVMENWRSRGQRYSIYRPSEERSLAARLMPYTGTIIFLFVIWHLVDFTFADRTGPRTVMPDGQSLGLYAIVYNSFSNPWHSLGYIVAMVALGFHLTHGLQSFFQTFGFHHPQYTPLIQKISNALGVLMAFGYSTIPVYVLMDSLKYRM